MSQIQTEGVSLRYTLPEDGVALTHWLNQPGVAHAFPMTDPREVEDSAKHWIGFSRLRSSLTAVHNEQPIGIATLCLMPYQTLSHQCLLSIVVDEAWRGKGVGTLLMNNILHLAKNYFRIEVVYLEVYEGNPAISLYQRFGFQVIGNQKHFMKKGDRYVAKIIMERIL